MVRKNRISIYVLSGFTDIEKSGNQSFKNTIKYLAEFGFDLSVFTLLPNDYENLANPSVEFPENTPNYHRLPAALSPILKMGRFTKDSVGKWKIEKWKKKHTQPGSASLGNVDHFDEYNAIGRSAYLGFMFLAVIIELIRVGLVALRNRPDVFYGVNGQGALCASILGRLFWRPVVTRFHGTVVNEKDLDAWRGKLWKFDEYLPISAYADLQIMTNDGTKGDLILRKIRGHRVKKQVFWRNGIDTDNMRLPQTYDRQGFRKMQGFGDSVVIMMASRLTLWKRVDRGIDAFKELLQDQPDLDVILVIAGDGPARRELEHKVDSLGLNGSIHFLGNIPNAQLNQYYGACDIFLSLYDISNLANPIYEALFHSLPVVSIDDGTTSGLLIHGRNAFLSHESAIIPQAVVHLKQLSADLDLRRTLGQQSKNIADEILLSWKGRMLLERKELIALVGGEA